MPAYPFAGHQPAIDPEAWVAPGARIVGAATVGPQSSVWYNVVIRADVMPVTIGARSNIQDGAVVHVTGGRTGGEGFATVIGDDVLIGHLAIVHGCHLMDRAFVGLGAIVMDGCMIEPDAMLAAGALLTPGKRIGQGELWVGRPARFARLLTHDEVAANRAGADHYVELARRHRESLA